MAGLTGYVGPQVVADGNQSTLVRQDKTGAQAHALSRAAMAEQTSRALVYAASIPPGTGQAPGTAIGTTACFTLANPSGTGVNLVIYQIQVGYISGTLGAGVLALLAHFSTSGAITAPTGGTAIVPTSMLLGGNATSLANVRFNNTVPASGLQIRSIASMGAGLASTATFPANLTDMVNGAVAVGPGQAVSVQGIAAGGTSPLIVVSMVWAEELV